MNSRYAHAIAAIGMAVMPSLALSAETNVRSVENIARELGSLRQEIAVLHDQINAEQQVYADQMRSLANQKNDLEIKISRSDLNIAELQRELQLLKERQNEQSAPMTELVPVLNKALATLRDQVADSLPFRRQERLEAIDSLGSRLATQSISPNKAVNQLWAFVEDELTLGRSSGIYTETLELDGQPMLARVLRLGKVAMYFSTESGKRGVIRAQGDGWQQTAITDAEQIAQLDALFSSYAKNIRTGMFTVPNFLPR